MEVVQSKAFSLCIPSRPPDILTRMMHECYVTAFVLWGALYALAGRWELRVHWPAAPRPVRLWEARLSRDLYKAAIVWPWIWFLYCVAANTRQRAVPVMPIDLLIWVSGAMLLQAAAGALRGLGQRHAAQDPQRVNLLAAIWLETRYNGLHLFPLAMVALWFVFSNYIEPSPIRPAQPGDWLVWPKAVWFFLLQAVFLYWCFFLAERNNWHGQNRPADSWGVELEESPFKDEMKKLAGPFGEPVSMVRACAARSDLDAQAVRSILVIDSDKLYHLINLRHLLGLNPSTLLALLCVHWAEQARAGSLAAKWRLFYSCRFWAHLLLHLFILAFLTTAIVAFLVAVINLHVSGAVPGILWMAGGVIPFFVALVRVSLRRAGKLRTRLEALEDAFKIWHTADRHEKRTAEDFARAYAEYHRFVHGIGPPWLLTYRLRLDLPFAEFLEKHGLLRLLENDDADIAAPSQR